MLPTFEIQWTPFYYPMNSRWCSCIAEWFDIIFQFHFTVCGLQEVEKLEFLRLAIEVVLIKSPSYTRDQRGFCAISLVNYGGGKPFGWLEFVQLSIVVEILPAYQGTRYLDLIESPAHTREVFLHFCALLKNISCWSCNSIVVKSTHYWALEVKANWGRFISDITYSTRQYISKTQEM